MNGLMKSISGAASCIGMVLAILLLSTGVALAQKGKGKHVEGKPDQHIAKAIEKLDLTEAQRDQIAELRDDFKEENEATIDRIKALRQQMREQMEEGDEEAAAATREQLKAAMAELKDETAQLQADIAAVLTPEQRAELAQMLEKRKDNLKERGKKGKKEAKGEIADRLDLTDEQKAKMEEIRVEFKQEHEVTIERMKALRAQLQAQREAGDEAAAAQTREEIERLAASMEADRREMKAELDAILTDAQREQLEEGKDKLKEKKEKKGRKGKKGAESEEELD